VNQLSPEITEIVRDIAARGDSVLLRVPRGSEIRSLREDRPVTRSAVSDLSRAERHLLTVYREEVAFALRQAAWFRVTTGESATHVFCRRHTSSKSAPETTARAVVIRAAESIRPSKEWPSDAHCIAVLESMIASSPTDWPSAAALCAAAQRLVPSYSGRLTAGLDYHIRARHESAGVVFAECVRSAVSADQLGIAWTNLAEAAYARGRNVGAWNAAQRAVRHYPSLFMAHVSCAWFSIQLADLDSARRAVRELEALAADDASLLDEHVQRFRRFAKSKLERLKPDGVVVLEQLRKTAGPLAGRLWDALE